MSDPASGQRPPPRPAWVKVLAAIAAVVLVAVVVMLVAGGEHSPTRHLPGGADQGGHTPPVEHAP